ncbi:MAG: VWA domain-containing protein [Acidobacteriota bacterium]
MTAPPSPDRSSPARRRLRRPSFGLGPLAAALVALAALTLGTPAVAKDEKKLSRKEVKALTEALPEHHRQWLEDVDLIISKDERRLFLTLDKDYQRDAFIEEFWKARDPYPRTARNEYREDYTNRLREGRQLFGNLADDRLRVLLTNGIPLQRIRVRCRPYLVPAEVWFYDGSDTVGFEFLLLFYQKWGAGKFRMWEPMDGIQELSLEGSAVTTDGIELRCGEEGRAVLAALGFLRAQGGQTGAMSLLNRIVYQPEAPKKEWVATFATYTSDLPEGAATFDAELSVDFPGRQQSRTVVRGNVAVPTANIGTVDLGEGLSSTHNLVLTGEVLREGKLFDSFRYQFDFPAGDDQAETLPLIFERYLRPGEYSLMVRLEDLGSGRFHRTEQTLEVPRLEKNPPPPMDPETARILEEATAAIRSGETTVKIAPLSGGWQTGLVRVDAMTTGDGIDRVSFLLDGQSILTKKRPPFNVELDLGNVPRARVLRVEAYDDAGEELAADEVMLNAGDHRFAVRLVEPRPGKTYRKSLRVQADVIVPKGEVVERVELFLNETKLTTLYQEPWVHPLVLPEEEAIAYVRAVAFAPDGNATEDLVFINAPANLEEIDVDFVELYTSVLDRDDRPVQGLERPAFRVLEDDVPQEIVRFELVENLPIHAAIMLDVSASMEGRLEQARDAAIHFFQQAITPKDRATAITFNDHPELTTDFTSDVGRLAAGLAGLQAERGTALYDSLVFSLYYFNGIRGQRTILLLSDGKDESSRFDFDDVLEYTRRAGVAIYAVGLQIPRSQFDARRALTRLSEETGGRSFFIEDVGELTAIYDAIQKELRSRYLIAYQSSNESNARTFRSIKVEVEGQGGLEAKTMRGYYP